MGGRVVLCLLVVLLATGCTEGEDRYGGTPTLSPTDSPTSTPAPARSTKAESPSLSRTLLRLTTSQNRSAFATTHDLTVEGGAVLVTVELASENAPVPSSYFREIERTSGGTVYGWVAYDRLRPLANQSQVRYVREAYPADPQ